MEFYKSRNFDRKKSNGYSKREEKPYRSFRNSSNDSSRYSRDDRKRESATVTCADCGTECEIPFIPKTDRPVYCSDCFKQNKPQDSRDDRSSRYSRDDRSSRYSRDDRSSRYSRDDRSSRYSRDDRKRESATVTCADCGTECEIPFIPKTDRPVYCSDCFKQNKPQDSRDDRSSRYSRDDRSSRYSRDDRSSKSSYGRESDKDDSRPKKSKSDKFLRKQESFYSNGSEKFYASLKEKLFEILGGKICSSCGFKDERALGISHIYDDQTSDSIRRGGSASSWGKYISEPDLAREELKVLCLNCNEIRQPVSKPKEDRRKKSRYFPR